MTRGRLCYISKEQLVSFTYILRGTAQLLCMNVFAIPSHSLSSMISPLCCASCLSPLAGAKL